MFMMLLLSAVLVGISLGLLGAGGSILTVPLLMLLVEMEEKEAIASALIIVAVIASFGVFTSFRNGNLDLNKIGVFALASLPAASIGAYIGMRLPQGVQTLILVVVMVIAAIKMIRAATWNNSLRVNRKMLFYSGIGAGGVTGLVGVGGGFLIVPALVLYAGLPMQTAIANSLALIVLNAFLSFFTVIQTTNTLTLDWLVVSTMAGIGGVAVIFAQFVTLKIDPFLLKKVFAYVLVIIAIVLFIFTYLPIIQGVKL